MTRFYSMARTTWTGAQNFAVFAMCTAAAMVLPMTLAAIGFQAA